MRIAPGHGRDTATAVVDALRRAGRLITAPQLAEFGRYGWSFGWMTGAVTAGMAERHDWPVLVQLGVGGGSFAAGVVAIGWAARRAAVPARRPEMHAGFPSRWLPRGRVR